MVLANDTLVTLRSLDLHKKGFGLDSEITAALLRQGGRPFEVPVSYYGHSHAEGKKITWRDAVACARIFSGCGGGHTVTPQALILRWASR